MNDFRFQPRLCWIFIAGIGTFLAGCNDEASAGKSNPTAAAFGPTLVIKASAPELSAEQMAALIAAPIEKQLAALEALPLVESICTEGQAEFLLHTKAGCNLKQLESLIADRLASLKDALPQSINDTGLEIQTKTAPLFVVTIYSPQGKHDNVYLNNVVKTTIREQLANVPGIGQVKMLGTGAAGDNVTVKQYPGIALLLAPTVEGKPTEIAAELKKILDELRTELPAGILLTFPINTANSTDPREALLLLEIPLPPGADANRRSTELSSAMARLSAFPGINNWVGFTRHPLEFGNHNPCVVLHATAVQPEQVDKKMRAAIQELFTSDAGIQVRLKSFGKPDPTVIRAAVSGPDVVVADDLAGKLVDKLQASRSYSVDQQRSPLAVKQQIVAKLDRSKLAAHGVTSAEVMSALENTLGIPPHEDTTREQINIPDMPQLASAQALAECLVKNANGNQIALSELATFESVPAKTVVYRVNEQPAVLLTAQSQGEQNPQEAREQIGAIFTAARSLMALDEEYQLVWLEE